MTIGDALLKLAIYPLALLAVWGASWILADSKISFPIRLRIMASRFRYANALLTFLECPACTSFWLGLITAILFLDLRWLAIPFALASCGTSLVLYLFVRSRS
jgi:hypothetical protein